MKTVAVIQARMGSTRLPGKVMKDIAGNPTLWWVVRAARLAHGVDDVVVATSSLAADMEIYEWCLKNKVNVFQGSETDVLSRFHGALIYSSADIGVRLTADCPFLDPHVIGEVVRLRKIKDVDYATNTDPPSYPDGLDVEVVTASAIASAHELATRPSDRDTVTRFIVRNKYAYPGANLCCPIPGLETERWVLDSPEDYSFIQSVAERLNKKKPPSYLEILSVLDCHPEIRKTNDKYSRNERFYDNLANDPPEKRSFAVSKSLHSVSKTMIPLGAQTFSKSSIQFPGNAPLFVTHGDGPYVYDVDGNDYIDCVQALLPNILGYRDPDVDNAIRDQLSRGISFSLATELEIELSDLLITHIPSAEMVRFGKNGSDVTTAAIRLARAYTGRDRVVVGGYHGWHDWSMIVTDRWRGIPVLLDGLSVRPSHDGEIKLPPKECAAIIVEPEFYTTQQLRNMRTFCTESGIVLIFDEIISGFRFGLGGIQKLVGVTPDLSCFGKSMANGMPISAIVGMEEIMKLMAPPNNIFYSGTFFGETLSIAAALATLDKLERKDVPLYLAQIGDRIMTEAEEVVKKNAAGHLIKFTGSRHLPRLEFEGIREITADEIKTLFIQEMIDQGILIIASNNLSYAHRSQHIDKIIKAYDEASGRIAEYVAHGRVRERLNGIVARGSNLRETA